MTIVNIAVKLISLCWNWQTNGSMPKITYWKTFTKVKQVDQTQFWQRSRWNETRLGIWYMEQD